MEIFTKALTACVLAALVGTVIKKDTPGLFVLIGVASIGVAAYCLIDALSNVIEFIKTFTDKTYVDNGIISILLKISLVAIFSGFASDVCKDAGMNAAASGAIFAGEVVSVYLSLPLIETVFKLFSNYV